MYESVLPLPFGNDPSKINSSHLKKITVTMSMHDEVEAFKTIYLINP